MINVELTFISGRCDFFSAWKYLTRLVVITPVGGVNFSIRGKEKASRLIKLVLVLMSIYFGLLLFNYMNNTTEIKIYEKTILLTTIITAVIFGH